MKYTPLHQLHIDSGARMVDFGGWHMPVQYSGLSQEHQAVRTKAGLFDVSHMGEIEVEGEEAEAFLNFLVTNNVSRLVDGQAQYTAMCYENGGVVDDLLVYRRGTGRYLLCVNASNTDKDWDWIHRHAEKFPKARCRNASGSYSQLALQGPLSERILSSACDADLKSLKYYHFLETELLGHTAIVSRTGYTGEDGFEIYGPSELAVPLWKKLMEIGQPLGLLPAGLGARDTLRTEMKFALYGHEINQDTDPLEAGLGWVVKLDKPGDFLGKAALQNRKREGLRRSLVGVRVLDKGIPRQGYELYAADQRRRVGVVTSGTPSPTLGYPIAIAYVEPGFQEPGSKIFVKVRERFFPAEVVPTPFHRKA